MSWDDWYTEAVRIIRAERNKMDYNIHEVEIRAILVRNHGTTSEIYFSHDLHTADRRHLADRGIPVFYDQATGFRYLTVDTALLSRNTVNKVTIQPQCECGAKAVGAFRHSSWCPCT